MGRNMQGRHACVVLGLWVGSSSHQKSRNLDSIRLRGEMEGRPASVAGIDINTLFEKGLDGFLLFARHSLVHLEDFDVVIVR